MQNKYKNKLKNLNNIKQNYLDMMVELNIFVFKTSHGDALSSSNNNITYLISWTLEKVICYIYT